MKDARQQVCSTCNADGDKDCICGGVGTRDTEVKGLRGAVEYWREKYKLAYAVATRNANETEKGMRD